MRRALSLLMLAATLAIGVQKAAALEPADVMVIYNTKSDDSLNIARHYMKAREIPEGNLIPLICGVGEATTEVDYRKNIVPQIQKALAAHPNAKCLVTTYDVPLKIGAWQPDTAGRQEINADKARLDQTLAEMDRQVSGYEHIAAAPDPAATQAVKNPFSLPPKEEPKRTLAEEMKKLNTAATAAVARLGKLPDAQKAAALSEIAALQEQVAGISGVLTGFQVKDDSPNAEAGHAQMEALQAKLREIEARMIELVKQRNSPDARKEMINLRRLSHGSVGEARQIEETLAFLDPPETEASFDNELALVLADQDYPRTRWLNNPSNVANYPSVLHWQKVPRTIMVTRLDGSTAQKTIEMIDTTLKTEKAGLEGKIYLDARGLKEGPYSVFDVQLRELAQWVKANSSMECVLDDRPEMLEAKDCPEAALYCGWYSLEHYVDVCQWVKGGVGYHVASGEMVTLHAPINARWVVNLLNRGYCGTLGPTSEPYLHSFPNPAHFFPLLMCGEFTQGEVWELTAPLVSWRTAYVGDPLYNPFKAHPKVKIEAIKEHPILRNAFTILRPQRETPATAPAKTQ